jgi:endonuclease/exonuclease/phosphatase family metal-dependent hydrolase
MRIRALIGTLVFAVCCFSLEAVENSIIPIVEHFETAQNISRKKYATDQYSEILAALSHQDECIRVATYNILFNIDDQKLDKENRWLQRLPRIAALIQEMQPDIIAVQELYPDQLNDLMPYLQDSFEFYAQTGEYGELNGIFYRKNRFERIDSRVWFLTSHSTIHISETLSMIQLKDAKTGKKFAVFNTHLPFSTPDAREFHARFIVDQMASIADKMPVILTGDLNTFPNRPDLKKLPFWDGDHVCNILSEKFLTDARNLALIGHLGPLSTFSNAIDDVIPFKGMGTPGIFLDHIFVSSKIQVLVHAVQPGTVDGHFPSDHLPVFADVILKDSKAGCDKPQEK